MESKQEKSPRKENNEAIDRFVFRWHDFPFDFWWRKKYKVPFGSAAHREMSFIDMYIEWREDLLLNRSLEEESASGFTPEEEAQLGLQSSSGKAVKMTQQEIEDDYEHLDLSQFDSK